MTINRKLFHLGNDVVRLKQKIRKMYPPLPYPHDRVGIGVEILEDILDIINEIRLELLTYPEKNCTNYPKEQKVFYLERMCDEKSREINRMKQELDILLCLYKRVEKEE